MNYFITAIGTDSGKTVIAAALAKALDYSYWKPVQAGYPTDANSIKSLAPDVPIIEEKYILKTPASPHYAAAVDGVTLNIENFQLPTQKPLIIEGAGGCLVPLNDTQFIIDLVPKLGAEIILVSNNYLGSINHTLLTLHYLKIKELPLKGIIFNDPPNAATEDIILKHADVPCIHKVGELEIINEESITKLSKQLKKSWDDLGW